MNEQNAGKAGIITVQMGAVISQLLHVYRPLGKGLPIKSHEIGLIMAISCLLYTARADSLWYGSARKRLSNFFL